MILKKDFGLKDLPEVPDRFKALPYVEAAIHLQKMPHEDRIKRLRVLAENDKEMKVIVLCRMLFTAKKNGKFRAPAVGMPCCMGGSKPDDFPLVPIEIVDGIPFVVVRGYDIEGFPEPSVDYLKYCLDNCDWSSTRFVVPSQDAKTKSLDKLLASKTWKRLSEDDRRFLISQVK
jgi:hypothetical protein